MIKNIPNKYTRDLMMQDINKNHQGTYDFFYLPIDFKVTLNSSTHQITYLFVASYRTDAMLDMPLSILLIQDTSKTSFWSLMGRNGKDLKAKRYSTDR